MAAAGALENVEDIYPLSPTQAGMLFHTLSAPGTGIYVAQVSFELDGEVDEAALRETWSELIARHGALRTAFLWDGLEQPLQVVRQRVATPWARLDWRAMPEEDAERWMEADRVREFDLAQAPLMRLTLIDLPTGATRLLWTSHHLQADGWSVGVIVDEMRAIYAARLGGRAAALAPAPAFREYIAWLRARDVEAAEPRWREYLRGFRRMTCIDLPPPEQPGDAARVLEQALPEATVIALREVARELRVTLSSLFLSAWAVLLHRYSGDDDVVFGHAVSGRPPGLAGVERAVGPFLATTPVRSRIAAAPDLEEGITALHRQLLSLRDVEHTPLSRIGQCSELAAGQGLFETLVAFESQPGSAAADSHGALRVTCVNTVDRSNYPLALLVLPGAPLRLRLVLEPSRFDTRTGRRLLAQLDTLLDAIPGHLHAPAAALPLLPDAERAHLLELGRGPALAEPEHGVAAQIAARARAKPEAVAVRHGESELRYGEMEARACSWAAHLRGRGVGRGDRVAVLLERGVDLPVALYAVLKAGAAYVPMDPDYPPSRLQQILSDCAARCVLTTGALSRRLGAGGSACLRIEAELAASAGPVDLPVAAADDPAYLIYTSGSSGHPKGVLVSHANLARSTAARSHVYGQAPDSFLMLSSIAFDSSVAGLYWTLTGGGSLSISERHIEQDPTRLVERFARDGVTHTLCLPSLHGLLLDHVEHASLDSLHTVIVAGEAVPQDLPARHRRALPATRLFNEYGPTEATVWCAAADITAHPATRPVPIGRPVPGTRLLLLDADGRLRPTGAAGEIHVAGGTVAAGYLGRAEESRKAFLPDPHDRGGRGRLYRTGDLGRWREDGELEFLGRADRQLKIRGHRIEPAEIESVLSAHPEVERAAVTATSGASPRLIAFVTPAGPNAVPVHTLREHLSARLPEFMHPASITPVDELPTLPNGKLDLNALRALQPAPAARPRRVPRTPFENTMLGILREVLAASEIGIDDNFFEHGGDSLLSIKVVSRARRAGIELLAGDLFDFPTVAELGQYCDAASSARRIHGDGASMSIADSPEEGRPLYMVHGSKRLLAQLSEALAPRRPVHLLTSYWQYGDIDRDASIESLAREKLDALEEKPGTGSLLLGGYSVGAPIALEMASLLRERGREVSLLVLIDPPQDSSLFPPCAPLRFESAPPQPARVGRHLEALSSLGPMDKIAYAVGKLRVHALTRWRQRVVVPGKLAIAALHRRLGRPVPESLRPLWTTNRYEAACRRYRPRPYPGPVLLFHTKEPFSERGRVVWDGIAAGELSIESFDCKHMEFQNDPRVVARWTRKLAEYVGAIDGLGQGSPPSATRHAYREAR